jgi:hypothetical protein
MDKLLESKILEALLMHHVEAVSGLKHDDLGFSFVSRREVLFAENAGLIFVECLELLKILILIKVWRFHLIVVIPLLVLLLHLRVKLYKQSLD